MHPPLPSLFIIDTFTGISLIKSLSLGVGQSRKRQAWVLVFHVCVSIQQPVLLSGIRHFTVTRAKDHRTIAVAVSNVAAFQQGDGGVAEQH